MGRKGEMQPSQIVDAVRDALPTTQVVDLTPSLMGAGCVMSLNLKDGPVYVLPNCKSVRKKLARGGMSAKAGSLRHDFEECDVPHYHLQRRHLRQPYPSACIAGGSVRASCTPDQGHMRHLPGAAG